MFGPSVVLLSVSLPLLGGLCLVAFLILMLFLMWANPGTNSGFLEWDPEAQSVWRAEIERSDVEGMLVQHNDERARVGLPPQSMDEFRDELRRESGGG